MAPPSSNEFLNRLIEKVSNSRFFTISLVLHILLIAIFGGTVLFQAYQEPPDFEGGEGGFLAGGEEVSAPPSTSQVPTETTFTVTTPTTASSVTAITTTGQNPLNFQMDAIVMPSSMPPPSATAAAAAAPSAAVGTGGMTAQVAGQIRNFTGGWGKGSGSGTGTRQREFVFEAFVAQYDGGNWDSTVDVDSKGRVWRGSLPNLLDFMSKVSRDKIKTNWQNVRPIRLDSDEIFTAKPPFIFFSGSKDFKLTDKEVANLQKYIRTGGAIWGDSSVPGKRSRFDIAFRREMKRVMPDKDKDFEPLNDRDPFFTQNPYFPEIRSAPAGLNFYREPVFVMRYLGAISIIYTANNYGDMWQFGIRPGRGANAFELNNDRNAEGVRVALDWMLYMNNGIYIHNVNPTGPMQSLVDSYKFGVNAVIHLLTRWEDKLRSAPRL